MREFVTEEEFAILDRKFKVKLEQEKEQLLVLLERFPNCPNIKRYADKRLVVIGNKLGWPF